MRDKKRTKKKKGRILVETGIITSALFLVLILAIMTMVYTGIVRIHLDDQKDKMRSELVRVSDSINDTDVSDWFFDYWEENYEKINAFDMDGRVANEVKDSFIQMYLDREWLEKLNDENKIALASTIYSLTNDVLKSENTASDYGDLFCVDIQEPGRGFVFFHYHDIDESVDRVSNTEGNLGTWIDMDPEKHPAVKEMLSAEHVDVAYERVSNFPVEGEHFVAYKPVYIDGSIRCVIGITYNWTSFSHSLRVGFYQMAFMCVGAILLVAVILHIFMYQKAIRPLKKIQTGVREYREKKDSAVTVERMSEITAGNEFGTLAGDVSELALEIDRYTEENIRLSTERERVIAELDMARSIQAGQLPSVFPAFPDRKEFDIYASMIPAREVGGDFYDFFFIDDDHLALVIADVSGKGVPAALFMMMSRIIISNYAMMGLSPAEVLRRSNDTIFRNNKEHMFVTAWFGIYEVSTGRVVAANAGHEYPVLRNPRGEYSFILDTHGFVLGGMENQTYEEYTFILQKGCTLVVYTDGYPEAMDSKGKMYGKERLKEALNRMPDADPKMLSEHALKSVMNYVGEAEQFDDLTMLILKRL